MSDLSHQFEQSGISRREFLVAAAIGGSLTLSGYSLFHWLKGPPLAAQTFIGKAADYQGDLSGLIRRGLAELGMHEAAVKGKRISVKTELS